MKGINKVTLIGNLGTNPEVRYFTNGDAVVNLSLATGETWRDKSTGEHKEKTEWHRVVLFRKLAEVAGKYFQKGDKIYIEGMLRNRKWKNEKGVDCYAIEIHGHTALKLNAVHTDNSMAEHDSYDALEETDITKYDI